jgi:4-hydroxy-tetrahydrodipicolinate synthase
MCGGRNFAGGRSKAMTSIDPKLRKALTGISGILVAPFDQEDKVAPLRLKPIVDRAIDAGVHILVANGNTGEFYGLTTAEGEAMVQAAAELIGGRVPLLAGVGRSINDACALARASRAAGASALMVHQPPDPFVSPRGVVAYVSASRKAATAFQSCSTCATMASASTRSSNCAGSRALLA